MIENLTKLRITEAEFALDVHGVIEKVRQGAEVVIEQDSRPVAVIKPTSLARPKMTEIIAELEASGASARLDEDFARDVEEAAKAYREPWSPPSLD
jgi:antitoxin (DNA-binding transcriptional repressor) of toxin-antitoxin stability system